MAKKIFISVFTWISVTFSFHQIVYSQNCVYQIQDIFAGPSGSYPTQITEFGTDLYFKATDLTTGAELWKFDGTTASLVADIRPSTLSSSPNYLTVFGGNIYFAANDGTNGTELWRSDGITTVMVGDINPGLFHSYPKDLIVMGSNLYFVADDGTNGFELWKYDGVSVSLAADINPGASGSFPGELTVVGSNLYLSADNGVNGFELWKYDGVSASLIDINPGAGSSNPLDLFTYGSNLMFNATNGTNGTELWKYNGTTASYNDINAGAGNSNPTEFAIYGGDLYFRAYTTATGTELWKYDGTTPSLVADIYPGGFYGFPDNLTVMGSELFFAANDGTNGIELWKYDGATVSMVANIAPGAADAFDAVSLQNFEVVGSNLFFIPDDGSSGKEIWTYNGVTTMIGKDIFPGTTSSAPNFMTPFGTDLYFSAEEGIYGGELWVWRPNADLDSSITVVNCGVYTSPSGNVYTAEGTYLFDDTITSIACPGCDSIITIDLTINQLAVSITVISCGPYISPGGTLYSVEGTYLFTDTLSSISCPGADSIVTVDLSIVPPISNSVTQFGGVLVAQATGVNYQWLDCDNGYAIVPGETNQDFIATYNGNFAVEVSLGGCIDTSGCFNISGIGFLENELEKSITLYPNPIKDVLYVQKINNNDIHIEILDNLGHLIFATESNASTTLINLNSIAKGIYFIRISDTEDAFVKKVLVE